VTDRAWPRIEAEVAHPMTDDGSAILPRPQVISLVRRQMRSLIGTDRELEDLTQAALERVVRGAPRFEGRAALSTYTYRMCVRLALNHWRSRRRWRRWFRFAGDSAPDPVDPAADAGAHLEQREGAQRLHALLDTMDPVRRVVLTLADLEEVPIARIAIIMECPEPTVKSRLRLARADLAALLARDSFFRGRMAQRGQP
jgi:RNA polymerase sigma-70 factor (ECF subfamily)